MGWIIINHSDVNNLHNIAATRKIILGKNLYNLFQSREINETFYYKLNNAWISIIHSYNPNWNQFGIKTSLKKLASKPVKIFTKLLH